MSARLLLLHYLVVVVSSNLTFTHFAAAAAEGETCCFLNHRGKDNKDGEWMNEYKDVERHNIKYYVHLCKTVYIVPVGDIL